ncbi:MAG: acetyl-CoA carboxylase subunit alpha/beta [Pseudorhodobacter sp.]|nr:acetyl-CoA carboxylase subunit alpha/beta [Frankiaceae bacterium]
MTGDWREPLLAGASLLDVRLGGRNPTNWPGYRPRPAVRAYRLRGAPGRPGPVAVAWDFSVQGGSFSEDDATVLAAAARQAVRERVPLVTLVRSGGTRLQEGVAALVGIPRARLALLDLAGAGLPHLSVADAPTTGGVWISVTSAADLRVAVEGATVGFAGPRVVEATTGEVVGPDSHTATSAYDAGLVDAVVPADRAAAWLATALRALAPTAAETAQSTGTQGPAAQGPATQTPATQALDTADPGGRGGWEQVLASRARTVSGRDLLAELLTDAVDLQAPRGDRTVAARVGRLGGQPVVGVALAAELGGRPTPDGYRLATRAFRLAGRLGLPVVSLVDTPGADPGSASEADGIASAMGEALDALLLCPSPTVALIHGEGGSGGALAVAVADCVLVTPDAYLAAIGPEGATAALRRPAPECADLMRITPADLLALGFADAVVTGAGDLPAYVAQQLARPPDARREARRVRWSSPLPGEL